MTQKNNADYAITNNTETRLKVKFAVYKGWSKRDNRGRSQHQKTYTLSGVRGDADTSYPTSAYGTISENLSTGPYEMEIKVSIEPKGTHFRTNKLPIAVKHPGMPKRNINTFDIRPDKTIITKGTKEIM